MCITKNFLNFNVQDLDLQPWSSDEKFKFWTLWTWVRFIQKKKSADLLLVAWQCSFFISACNTEDGYDADSEVQLTSGDCNSLHMIHQKTMIAFFQKSMYATTGEAHPINLLW
jgi:predicted small secreted protein